MLNLYKICSKMHGVMEKVRYTPGIRNKIMTTCLIQYNTIRFFLYSTFKTRGYIKVLHSKE